jgi:hypothetical protein
VKAWKALLARAVSRGFPGENPCLCGQIIDSARISRRNAGAYHPDAPV